MIGLSFKCSETGQSFGVLLQYKSNKYHIVQIDKSPEREEEFKHFPLTPNSVDFSGFYCPFCKHDVQSSETRYIMCGRCSEYFCGATCKEVELGFEFTCPCGYSGEAALGNHSRSFIAIIRGSSN